jgi:uncharacterized SAM-binding protein YcdF (DUF218 family)
LLIAKRRQKLIRGLFALGILTILCLVFLTERSRILSVPLDLWSQTPKADCAVVLTGGAHRIREGFDLLARGHVQKLIISGVHSEAELREIFPLWTVYSNLDREDDILEKRSGTTFGNAHQTQPLVQVLGCQKMVLITSQLHMHRALMTFRSVFGDSMEIIPHSVHLSRSERGFLELWTEVLKSLFYSLWAY